MKKQNVQELQTALAKYKDGSTWHIRNVAFLDERIQYLGCSHKICVDIRGTKWIELLCAPSGMPSEPQPSASIADMLKLKLAKGGAGQRFDITGLVTLPGNPQVRVVDTRLGMRAVCDVCLVDGSVLEATTTAESGSEAKKAKMSFTIWMATVDQHAIPEPLRTLRDLQGQPVSFFNLNVGVLACPSAVSCRESLSDCATC